jgi:hypothetical protein
VWIVFVSPCVKITLRFSPELSTFRQVSYDIRGFVLSSVYLTPQYLTSQFPFVFLAIRHKKRPLSRPFENHCSTETLHLALSAVKINRAAFYFEPGEPPSK